MFNLDDFKVFDDPTLEGRLDKIKKIIDPKFEMLGENLIKDFQSGFDKQLYIHIAKHIRRHKNPPPDTWMAINTNKRSYKALPHIEIGFWPDCIFTNISFLTEIDDRKKMVDILAEFISFDMQLGISTDHTQSDLVPLTKENFNQMTQRYLKVKSADLVIGYVYEKENFDNYKINKNFPVLFELLKKFE